MKGSIIEEWEPPRQPVGVSTAHFSPAWPAKYALTFKKFLRASVVQAHLRFRDILVSWTNRTPLTGSSQVSGKDK